MVRCPCAATLPERKVDFESTYISDDDKVRLCKLS